jgi:hypothetical protein
MPTNAAPDPKSFNCPTCGAPIRLRALGASVMVACASCGTQIDVSKPEIQVIKKFTIALGAFQLALGARGPLRGQTYEIIGAMIRSIDGFRWTEYLLFNPYVGFRWLVEDSGHWSLAETIKDVSAIKPSGYGLAYRGADFRKYAAGDAVVEAVVGEFYWRVKVGDRASTVDYVAPPWMLSREKTGAEVIWSHLEYLEPEEVGNAFKADVRTPDSDDVAPHQPDPATQTLTVLKRWIVGALGLAVAVQVATVLVARSQSMPIGRYVPAAGRGQESVFGPIHLEARRSLNELTATGALDNSWVDLDYALVNKATGESTEFGSGFEFYSGADSDGSWSEGSTRATALVTSLPAGDYDVVVDSASGDKSGQVLQQPITLTLRHDVVPWRNFWLAVAAIVLYPGWLAYRGLVFERNRWSASNFNIHGSEKK